MTVVAQSEAVVTAKVDARRRLSPIWAIPVVSVLIAGWLVWDTLSKRGPLITVTFQAAEGLQAGQSRLRHRDVDVGLVEGIALSPDLGHVIMTIRMNREAEPLLTEGARFWVVKPRLFAGNLSGLGTLLSGSYIGVAPSVAGGQRQTRFTGLENPPLLEAHEPGRTFLLRTGRLGSISLGSPIFYRDLPVGEVLGWDLGEMASNVTIHAFVRAPFDQYVRDGSRFWNASGVSLKLGTEGVQLEVESVRALLMGGIAFDTPTNARALEASAADHTFPLHLSQEAANNAAYHRRVQFVSYFPGSVSGLGPGSAVTFQGLRVGNVTGLDLEYDATGDAVRVPVRFEVEPERIADVRLVEGRGPVANTRLLVERGLRAKLESANLLTGQMQVALEMVAHAEPAELGVEGNVLVLPTVPGQFAGITDAVNQLLAKLDRLPFEQIGQSLNETLRGVDGLVNGQELKQSVVSLQATLASVQDLAKQLDQGLAPALRQLPGIASGLQSTVAQANRLLLSTDRGYGDNSRFSRDVDRLMQQLNDAARSLRILADLLTRHPEALIRGRTNQGLQ
jgi:paraquat-inducible protein B